MWSLLSNNPISYYLSAFSFKMFICKEEPTICIQCSNEIRPNMPFTTAAALFSHKIYSINENPPTNKTIMSRMLPLEPIMVEGALCSKEKEKCVWGDFRLFVFKAPSQPSPFPSVPLFLLHISARVHSDTHTSQVSAIYASARIQLTQLSSKDSIYWLLF